MITRIGEEVFFEIFNTISKGKGRIPLSKALNGLNSFFNSHQNPYKKHICEDSSDHYMTSEEFMNNFYTRNVDIRHGLRSQILMVGGPKNIRGNPGGHLDSMLSFPQITFDQFFRIAKDMETIFLEKMIPGLTNRKLKKENIAEKNEQKGRREIEEIKTILK
ncbi:hypothetical protein MACJ_003729 [Theileria orientalis]|uniref:Uncharacterized protein n=1 Tax=Theileria orientalis TaxID=68886 RepID=A0A976SLL8_THEOR|nr:hypothetical protein MACJ_003729 [Theileria orientalis]